MAVTNGEANAMIKLTCLSHTARYNYQEEMAESWYFDREMIVNTLAITKMVQSERGVKKVPSGETVEVTVISLGKDELLIEGKMGDVCNQLGITTIAR